MMYKAKIAVCSEIRKKTLNAKRAPCRNFECYLVVRRETARLLKFKRGIFYDNTIRESILYVSFVCKCVLAPGDNPTAVNKYIISKF
jgi:hypothetical protein